VQINIDKKSGIFVAIIAVLLVVIAAISFSSGRGEHSGMHDMGHEMDHGMGGMMSDEDMSTLESSTGAAFDKFFLTSMIAHHEGALHMVLMIQDSKDSNLLTLRDNIMKTQSAEIEWMKKILG
jgi:uncharacterized protein (DUF305 family)